jgi:tRNA 2-thiouridine synthesizing protein A
MNQFDLQIDASGLLCPQPLLLAKKALNQLKKGQILKVLTTDPAAVIDFKAFAAVSGHALVHYEARAEGGHGFWLERG